MRYKEFKLTEDELFELKMSPTNLKKMAADTGAIAGIEFEMYVPNAAEEDEYEQDAEPDYEMDESFPTGRGWDREVIQFFTGGDTGSSRSTIQRALDELNEEYLEWVDEQFSEWLDDNFTVLLDLLRDEIPQDDEESDDDYATRIGTIAVERGGPEYERAMETMRDDFFSEDRFDEFLDAEDINSYSQFGDRYSLDWPYWTYPEPSGGNIDIDDVARSFKMDIGRPVTTGGYHSGARSQTNNYRIEGDSSLHDPADPADGGLEFISPPLPLDEMLSDLEKVVKWAERNDCYTNDTCGLHMNVSIPNYDSKNLDYVKLAIFLGDEYILKEFGRLGNRFCKSAMEGIRKIAKTQPDKVQTMLQQMQGNLSAMASKIVHTGNTDKYTSINTQDGYIEFRSPGGDWLGEYAADPGKINNTLLRCAVALDVATKPELHRQEYMKKLYKTLSLGESDDTIQFFARYAAGELPQSALKSFVKQAQLQRKAKKIDPNAEKGKELIQWKATSGAATATVVARTEEEARKKAALQIGIPFSDSAMSTMNIQPVDLYTGPVNRYNIFKDSNGALMDTVEGVDERDAVATFRIQKPQWGGADITARLVTAEPAAPSRDQEFTGTWEVVSRPTDEVIYTMSGIGNAVQDAERHAQAWAERTGFDDPIYVRPQMRPRLGAGGGGFDRAPHTSIFQVINYRTGEVVRSGETITFVSLLDRIRHAHAYQGGPDPYSGDLKIVDLNTNTVYNLDGSRFNPVLPGSTQDRINQRLAAQPEQLYNVRWTDENGEHDVNRRAPNANAAMEDVRNSLESGGFRINSIEANPIGQSQSPAPARGTEDLPPGNARWLILDRNDNEVYSFINTTWQRDANEYARRWILDHPEARDRGPFNIVPAR